MVKCGDLVEREGTEFPSCVIGPADEAAIREQTTTNTRGASPDVVITDQTESNFFKKMVKWCVRPQTHTHTPALYTNRGRDLSIKGG